MKLTGLQIHRVEEALLSAYPGKDQLAMMVRIELDANLETIAAGENLRVIVFKLVTWAESNGCISELIEGACRRNVGNPQLQDLAKEAHDWPELRQAGSEAAANTATTTPAVIDIFLSYSHLDVALMQPLYDQLRGAGFSVWIDEGLEPGTSSWKSAIQEAVSQAQCMVVLLTPRSKASKWVNNEVSYASTLKRHIVPVLAAGDESNAVPIDLINIQWVDVRHDSSQAIERVLVPAIRRHVSLVETTSSNQQEQSPEQQLPPKKAVRYLKLPSWPRPTRAIWRFVLIAVATGVILWQVIALVLQAIRPSSLPPPSSASAVPVVTQEPLLPSGTVTRTNPIDAAVYVLIPAGEFTMGSNDGREFERPAHSVVTGEFWIKQTEVTQGEYSLCSAAGVCNEHPDAYNASLSTLPATNISWDDAGLYARWAGGRLPTEAEWEKACRGAEGRKYPWGTDDSPTLPDYTLAQIIRSGQLEPVGQHLELASSYGVLGLLGAVQEWTSSLWGADIETASFKYPYSATDGREDVSDQLSPRVLRGIQYRTDLGSSSSGCAARFRALPYNPNSFYGFRVVIDRWPHE